MAIQITFIASGKLHPFVLDTVVSDITYFIKVSGTECVPQSRIVCLHPKE